MARRRSETKKGGLAKRTAAISAEPFLTGIHNNLGIALIRSDKIDEAAAEFRSALGLNLEKAEANYNLANALVQKEGWLQLTRSSGMSLSVAATPRRVGPRSV